MAETASSYERTSRHHQQDHENQEQEMLELLQFMKTSALRVVQVQKTLVHLVTSSQEDNNEEDGHRLGYDVTGLDDLERKIQTCCKIQSSSNPQESSSTHAFFQRWNSKSPTPSPSLTTTINPKQALHLTMKSLHRSIDYFENEWECSKSKIMDLESQLQMCKSSQRTQFQEMENEIEILRVKNKELSQICETQTNVLYRCRLGKQPKQQGDIGCDCSDDDRSIDSSLGDYQKLQTQLEIEQRQKGALNLKVDQLEDKITDLEWDKEQLSTKIQQQASQISKLEQANRFKKFYSGHQEKIAAELDQEAMARKGVSEDRDGDHAHLNSEKSENRMDALSSTTDVEVLQKVTARLELLEDENERMQIKIKSQEYIVDVVAKEKDSLEQYTLQIKDKIETLEDDLEQSKSRNATLHEQCIVLEQRIEGMQSEQNLKDQQHQHVEKEMRHLTKQVHALEEERNQLRQGHNFDDDGGDYCLSNDKLQLSEGRLDFLSM